TGQHLAGAIAAPARRTATDPGTARPAGRGPAAVLPDAARPDATGWRCDGVRICAGETGGAGAAVDRGSEASAWPPDTRRMRRGTGHRVRGARPLRRAR